MKEEGIFQTQTFYGQKSFWHKTKIIFDLKYIWITIFFQLNIFWAQIFLTQYFSEPKNSNPIGIVIQIIFGLQKVFKVLHIYS